MPFCCHCSSGIKVNSMLTKPSNSYSPYVVIVENDENDAIILSRALGQTGLNVKSCWVCSVSALDDFLESEKPDLIICDFNLGDGTAIDVIESLHEHNIFTPVIVVSHHIGEKTAVEVMKAGAKDVINKEDYKHLMASVSKELIDLDRQFEREKLTTQIYDIDNERRELKQALEKVKEAESQSKSLLAQLNKVFESSPDGIRVIDKDYNVIRVNSNYLKFTSSLTRSSQTGKCYDATPGEMCNTQHCPLTRIFNGESHLEMERRLPNKNGHEERFVLSASAMVNEDGEIVGVLENLRNVTEWHAMQRQMLHAQKMESIGQLAAGIAHEINTPTQFVGDNISFLKDSFTELMRLITVYEEVIEKAKEAGCLPKLLQKVIDAKEEADLEFLSEEIPQAIAQSADGTRRIASIVKAMKEFSHPGSEDAELFNVNQNIQNTVTVARNEWKYVSRVDLDFGENLPAVRGYPGEFNQTILNMVVNAAHAIASRKKEQADCNGVIRLKTSVQSGHVIVKVKDNGAGIPPEIVNRIFDPFFTTKGVGKGTGQGLAIAHSSIVDKHNGKIEVESVLGEGTVFTIYLPSVELENPEVSK